MLYFSLNSRRCFSWKKGVEGGEGGGGGKGDKIAIFTNIMYYIEKENVFGIQFQ